MDESSVARLELDDIVAAYELLANDRDRVLKVPIRPLSRSVPEAEQGGKLLSLSAARRS